MPSERARPRTDDELRWVSIVEEERGVTGEVGLPAEFVTGKLRYLDGYAVSWASATLRFDRETLIATARLYGDEEAEKQARNSPEVVRVPTPLVCLMIHFPDWPSDDAMTYVLPVPDADDFLLKLQQAMREAKGIQGRQTKALMRLGKELRSSVPDTRTQCSTPDCTRNRSFFDSDGQGYCKIHAEEMGLRPHGKIT